MRLLLVRVTHIYVLFSVPSKKILHWANVSFVAH